MVSGYTVIVGALLRERLVRVAGVACTMRSWNVASSEEQVLLWDPLGYSLRALVYNGRAMQDSTKPRAIYM